MKQIRGLLGEEDLLKCPTVKYGTFLSISTTSSLLIEYISSISLILFNSIFLFCLGIWCFFLLKGCRLQKCDTWPSEVPACVPCNVTVLWYDHAKSARAKAQARNLALDPAFAESSLPVMGRLSRAHTFLEVHESVYVHHATLCFSWVHVRK